MSQAGIHGMEGLHRTLTHSVFFAAAVVIVFCFISNEERRALE